MQRYGLNGEYVVTGIDSHTDWAITPQHDGGYVSYFDVIKLQSSLTETKALLAEVLEDPPENECADEGTNCSFCWEPRKQISLHGSEIKHKTDCWILRARALNT